jgi:hypothetical protein
MFRSTDGGRSFTPVGRRLLATNELASNFSNSTAIPIVFSPTFTSDHTVYAYSSTAVLRSRDGGTTWARLTLPRTLHDDTTIGGVERPWLTRRAVAVGAALVTVIAGAATVPVVLRARRSRQRRLDPT